MENDPYKILGIEKSATDDEIKQAYRKLALKWHPDKNKEPGAQEKFVQITESYEKIQNQKIKSGEGISGFKIFESMFENLFPEEEKLDIHKTVDLTLEQFYTGYNTEFVYQRRIIDPDTDHGMCNVCKGNKLMRTFQQLSSYINETNYKECQNCNGKGFIGDIKTVNHTIYLSVPKGCESDKKIVIKDKGNETIEGEKGDFILQLNLIENENFTRHTDDLQKTITISLKKSLLGFKYKLKKLDNTFKTIKINGIIKPDTTKRIRNLGMPVKEKENEYGDLYLKFKIKFPKTLTDQQKETIEKLF